MSLNFAAPFRFEFSLHKAPDFAWNVSKVDLPDISLPAIDMGYPTTNMPEPGDKLDYSPLSVTFKLDEELEAYKDIFNWMQTISLSRGWFKDGSVKSDAVLIINNSNHIEIASLRFEDLWPTSLSSINFDYSAGDEFLETTVTFAYRRFDFNGGV